MRASLRIVTVMASIPALAACSGSAPDHAGSPALTLFVAASLTDVIQQVGDAYARERPVELTYNFAGSGALAQQLLAAPRADLFLSASERWMDEVEGAGRILEGSRRTLLSNSLVVIVNPGAGVRSVTPADLCAPWFRYLAIGAPDSVPAGRYARQWLQSIGCADGAGAWSRVEALVSPAPDVRAALAQVEGSADVAGIVYRTDYVARRSRVRLVYEVPADEGPAIRYVGGIVASSAAPGAARELLEFLAGPRARALFERSGFRTVPPEP